MAKNPKKKETRCSGSKDWWYQEQRLEDGLVSGGSVKI
jgi:hypothetical protein